MSDSEVKVKSVILRLILEYEIYENWQNCVSISFTNRISWLQEFVENFSSNDIYNLLNVEPQDSFHQVNVRLVKMMDLMHRVEDLQDDDDYEHPTPFEEILELTDQMLELRFKEMVKASLLKVKRAAQQESVTECLRQKKFNLATTVFERVWSNVPSSMKSAKDQLALMLKDDTINLSPSTFNDCFKQFLSKNFGNLSTPFLTVFSDKLLKSSPSSFGLFSKKKKFVSDISSCKHTLVKCWLSNYFCYIAFNNVKLLHTEEFTWIQKFIMENNLDFKSSLIIRFLFKYNDHLTSEKMCFMSPIELSLNLLEEIEKLYPETLEIIIELLNKLKYQLKKAAILNWCMENNFENANKLFEKLVDKETEITLREDLEEYLKGEKSLNLYDKSDLQTTMEEYMNAIFESNPPIFLISTSRKVLANIEKLVKEKNLEKKETKKIEESSYEHEMNEEFKPSLNGQNNLTNFKNTNSNVKTKKKVWLEEEEKLIYKGTKIFGVGNWSTIARKLLIGRSNTDVKDKWRTMVKQGKVKKFETKTLVKDEVNEHDDENEIDNIKDDIDDDKNDTVNFEEDVKKDIDDDENGAENILETNTNNTVDDFDDKSKGDTNDIIENIENDDKSKGDTNDIIENIESDNNEGDGDDGDNVLKEDVASENLENVDEKIEEATEQAVEQTKDNTEIKIDSLTV